MSDSKKDVCINIDPVAITAGLPKPILPNFLLSPFFNEIGVFLNAFQENMKKLNLNGFMTELSEFTKMIPDMQDAHRIRMEKYPNLAGNLKEIATHSWFTSLIMDFRSYEELGFVIDGLKGGEQKSALIETTFFSYFQENIGWLGKVVIEKSPQRAFAIAPALLAHARGEYALSVPVFLSQAEGVLRDVTSTELFTKLQNISVYASAKRSEVNFDESWLGFSDDAYWAQLSDDLPIGWNKKQRDKNNYNGFNRNTTLHGIDMHYDTEVNSLKAFSLLCHVVGLIEVVEDSIAAD